MISAFLTKKKITPKKKCFLNIQKKISTHARIEEHENRPDFQNG
jgi:hypothetical protein